ncbi:hypothetical protein O6H91_09G095100 [Diphasiastrum complanatum]|uniref:Uncharacterized protein n=1 Tax=Diphasiastrum complanatum TaxID=34168 RepID=A0ACC2CSA3_DIPCM|nr:hypothetical protein O6H91_Y074000 [Diphasiastrum complanatum]KAJ7544825.1 hypothetical protein O6H91_09G095100 [Diphasiastrum complanatum]
MEMTGEEAIDLQLQQQQFWWQKHDEQQVALYATLGVFLVTLFVVFSVYLAAIRRKKSDTILIVGLSGSGKTVLYYQLRDGSTHEGTVTSMQPNEDRFVLHSELEKKGKLRAVHVVDVPGHARLRPKLDEFLRQAQGIIFMVDALDFMPNIRPTAEYLFEVLSKPLVVKKKIPVLLVCNKMDKVTAHSMDFIRKQLEKEIDKLRTTQSSISEADLSSGVFLGTQGEAFKFTQCTNKLTVVESSALTGKISEVEQFIRSYVKP